MSSPRRTQRYSDSPKDKRLDLSLLQERMEKIKTLISILQKPCGLSRRRTRSVFICYTNGACIKSLKLFRIFTLGRINFQHPFLIEVIK